MKRWKLIAVGLGAYAVGLLVNLPATLIDAGLERATGGRLRLVEAQGTLWSGAGRIEIRDASGQSGVSKGLAWRLAPRSLFRGTVAYDLELEHSPKRFPATISFSRIELAQAEINLPASALGLGVPKLAALRLTGDLRLQITSLSLGRRNIQGNATLQWRVAGSALAPVSPLGDYELRLQGEGDAVRASLRTLQGPLQLEGKGSWTDGGEPLFQATARIPAQHREQLAPLLQLIAIERGEGSFDLQLK